MSTRKKAEQVGGDHYKKMGRMPWWLIDVCGLGYHDGAAVKYLSRDKGNKIEDAEKAISEIERIITIENEGICIATRKATILKTWWNDYVESNNLSEEQASAIYHIIFGNWSEAIDMIEKYIATLR